MSRIYLIKRSDGKYLSRNFKYQKDIDINADSKMWTKSLKSAKKIKFDILAVEIIKQYKLRDCEKIWVDKSEIEILTRNKKNIIQ